MKRYLSSHPCTYACLAAVADVRRDGVQVACGGLDAFADVAGVVIEVNR